MTEPLRDEAPPDDIDADTDTDAEHTDPDAAGPGLPPPGLPMPTAVESLVNALIEAGPEVAEHVVQAAQELLLAVQVVVDAADRAVKEQQTIRADRRDADDDGEAEVRHLDLAD